MTSFHVYVRTYIHTYVRLAHGRPVERTPACYTIAAGNHVRSAYSGCTCTPTLGNLQLDPTCAPVCWKSSSLGRNECSRPRAAYLDILTPIEPGRVYIARVHPPPPRRSRTPVPSACHRNAFSVLFAQVPFFLLPALGGVGVFVAVYVLSHQYDVSLTDGGAVALLCWACLLLRGLVNRIFFSVPSRNLDRSSRSLCIESTYVRSFRFWLWSSGAVGWRSEDSWVPLSWPLFPEQCERGRQRYGETMSPVAGKTDRQTGKNRRRQGGATFMARNYVHTSARLRTDLFLFLILFLFPFSTPFRRISWHTLLRRRSSSLSRGSHTPSFRLAGTRM